MVSSDTTHVVCIDTWLREGSSRSTNPTHLVLDFQPTFVGMIMYLHPRICTWHSKCVFFAQYRCSLQDRFDDMVELRYAKLENSTFNLMKSTVFVVSTIIRCTVSNRDLVNSFLNAQQPDILRDALVHLVLASSRSVSSSPADRLHLACHSSVTLLPRRVLHPVDPPVLKLSWTLSRHLSYSFLLSWSELSSQ